MGDIGPLAELLERACKVPPDNTPDTRPAPPALGVVIGELVALGGDPATPWVRLPDALGAAVVRARSTMPVTAKQLGQHVVLSFENGDLRCPIVLGALVERAAQPEAANTYTLDAAGQQLTVSSQRELVLRCGKASITLTEAGKVLIEGEYVSARSAGLVRIRGGAIHLN